ncbi:MAG: hypothetical protein Kow0010_13430 [Dehalococcoidia bacterium]
MLKTWTQVFWVIGIALAVVTGVEYIIAIEIANEPNLTLLSIIAVAKAVLIIYFFMHIYRLWREEGH